MLGAVLRTALTKGEVGSRLIIHKPILACEVFKVPIIMNPGEPLPYEETINGWERHVLRMTKARLERLPALKGVKVSLVTTKIIFTREKMRIVGMQTVGKSTKMAIGIIPISPFNEIHQNKSRIKLNGGVPRAPQSIRTSSITDEVAVPKSPLVPFHSS
jgi:hypothetical protein